IAFLIRPAGDRAGRGAASFEAGVIERRSGRAGRRGYRCVGWSGTSHAQLEGRGRGERRSAAYDGFEQRRVRGPDTHEQRDCERADLLRTKSAEDCAGDRLYVRGWLHVDGSDARDADGGRGWAVIRVDAYALAEFPESVSGGRA